jgi:hypothetical protein
MSRSVSVSTREYHINALLVNWMAYIIKDRLCVCVCVCVRYACVRPGNACSYLTRGLGDGGVSEV